MADEPSFFSKLCCCSRESKEPPVTLIRSGLTPPPQPRLIASEIDTSPQTSQISPAKGTVDGLVDEIVEEKVVATVTTKAPKWRAEVEEIDEMNMNDVMMSELCGQEENQENVEDAVSIRTDVVEEVNEEDLWKLTEQGKMKEDKEDKRDEENEEKEDDEDYEESEEEEEEKEEDDDDEEEEEEPELEQQETTRSKEYVTFSTMLEEGYESPRQPETVRSTDEEEKEEKDTPTIKVTEAVTEDEEEEGEEEESEEEIMVDDISETITPPQPKQRSPQPSTSPLSRENISNERHNSDTTMESPLSPPKMSSMMYADLSSDEESSDDEAEREVLPPVARPEEDKTDVEDNWEDKSEKENRITRLSLKSNGQATMTTGAVRIALDSVELTDDEFSEKLI